MSIKKEPIGSRLSCSPQAFSGPACCWSQSQYPPDPPTDGTRRGTLRACSNYTASARHSIHARGRRRGNGCISRWFRYGIPSLCFLGLLCPFSLLRFCFILNIQLLKALQKNLSRHPCIIYCSMSIIHSHAQFSGHGF